MQLDLETRAREIAASPHSFAGQDISAVINELVDVLFPDLSGNDKKPTGKPRALMEQRRISAIHLVRRAVAFIAEDSEALRNSIEVNGKLSDDPDDHNTVLAVEEMEEWLEQAKAVLVAKNEVDRK